MRPPTAPVAAGTLVLGFAVAQAARSPLAGGVVLLAGVACCVTLSRHRGWRRLAVVGLVGAAAFAGSHVAADVVGPWPSVLLAAAVTGATAWALLDARPPRAPQPVTVTTTSGSGSATRPTTSPGSPR